MLDHLGEHAAHDIDRRGHHEGAVERRYEDAGYGREGVDKGNGRCDSSGHLIRLEIYDLDLRL